MGELSLHGLVISPASFPFAGRAPVEVVERKGLGHPDSICDSLAEEASLALCRLYVDTFGIVLHHNVDKALLWAGQSEPAFGGGVVKEPMEIFLSGRAAHEFQGKTLEIDALIVERAQAWLRENLHALDVDRQVRLRPLVRPGSRELVELFARQQRNGIPLANDTSCGVGFAPLTTLERLVLDVERKISALGRGPEPAVGEDVKVMGVRRGDEFGLTVSAAMIGRSLPSLDAYRHKTEALAEIVREVARQTQSLEAQVTINAADDIEAGSVFLTVAGTSAEAGDDGQAGRGNRANGLITPYRPMVMESWAGKNPVTHPGKVYSVIAQHIAEAVVDGIPEATHADCQLVSRIGAPLDQPALGHIRVGGLDEAALDDARGLIEMAASECLAGVSDLWRTMIAGREVLG